MSDCVRVCLIVHVFFSMLKILSLENIGQLGNTLKSRCSRNEGDCSLPELGIILIIKIMILVYIVK